MPASSAERSFHWPKMTGENYPTFSANLSVTPIASSAFVTEIIAIYGEGRVILVVEEGKEQIIKKEKRIDIDQLQKIS